MSPQAELDIGVILLLSFQSEYLPPFFSFLFLGRDQVPSGSPQQCCSPAWTANEAELLQTFCTKKLLSNIIRVPSLSGTQLPVFCGDGLYWLQASRYKIFARGRDTPASVLQQRDVQ